MDAPMTPRDHDHDDDEFIDHGWGDLKSWSYILALCAFLVILSLVAYRFVGSGMHTEWNLGYPPTAPGFMLPFLGL